MFTFEQKVIGEISIVLCPEMTTVKLVMIA